MIPPRVDWFRMMTDLDRAGRSVRMEPDAHGARAVVWIRPIVVPVVQGELLATE